MDSIQMPAVYVGPDQIARMKVYDPSVRRYRVVPVGTEGDPDNHIRAMKIWSRWQTTGKLSCWAGPVREEVTVGVVCRMFMEQRFPSLGPSEQRIYKAAVSRLMRWNGSVPVAKFGPKALDAYAQRLDAEGLSRQSVSHYVNRVLRVMKHGLLQEVVPASIWMVINEYTPRLGKQTVAKPLPSYAEVTKAIASMEYPEASDFALVLLYTGMRTNELATMRVSDLTDSGSIMLYTPASHKTAHRGKSRTIVIGPRAITIIRPLLIGKAPDALVMPLPKVPQKCGRPNKLGWTATNLAYHLDGGCKQAGIDPFTPHQIRKVAATHIRKTYGLEAAQIMLGHSSAAVTDAVYAQRDIGKVIDAVTLEG